MSDLILPTEEQVERAAWALASIPGTFPHQGGCRHAAMRFLVLLLNKDKILGEPAVTEAFIAQQLGSPYALTEDHVASLERAIRAEGYTIKVDTETGEVKLYRVSKPLTHAGGVEVRSGDLEDGKLYEFDRVTGVLKRDDE